MKLSDALLNATAVWFILKAVEVLPLAIYDVFTTAKHWISLKASSDTTGKQDGHHRYDSRRGKLEYITLGEGFGNICLFRKSKKWFTISTIVPLVVFVLELLSIFLGNETKSCQTSTDRSVISAPGLELFGRGRHQTNIDELFNLTFGAGSGIRPCVTLSSSYSGIDYFSSLCVQLINTANHAFLINGEFPENQWIRVLMSQAVGVHDFLFYPLLVVAFASPTSYLNAKIIGSLPMISEVIVNGKGVLLNNVTSRVTINEKIRQQLRADVYRFEELRKLQHSEYVEDEDFFGFQFEGAYHYVLGAEAVGNAVLAQTTRSRVKPAIEMSFVNGVSTEPLDISCQDDFLLPRTISIVIIVTAVVLRISLFFIPTTVSSAEFALTASEEIANSEECKILFMNRKRAVCSLMYSNNGVSNHVGYTSLARPGQDPGLPWRGGTAL